MLHKCFSFVDLKNGQKQHYIHFEKMNSDNFPKGLGSSLVLKLSFGGPLVDFNTTGSFCQKKTTFVLIFDYLEEGHMFNIQSLLFN